MLVSSSVNFLPVRRPNRNWQSVYGFPFLKQFGKSSGCSWGLTLKKVSCGLGFPLRYAGFTMIYVGNLRPVSGSYLDWLTKPRQADWRLKPLDVNRAKNGELSDMS